MPTNPSVIFKRGSLANLPASVVDGTIYVTTDEGAMYIDNGAQRVRLGDFIPVETISNLPAAGHAYETAVYYVKTGNILARWDKTNSRWIQINKAGVVEVISDGSTGNVITGVAIDTTNPDGTLRLKISKATVATNDDFSDLMDRVDVAEKDIDNLQSAVETINGDASTAGSILNAVNTAKQALLGGATTYTTFKAIEDAITGMLADISTHGTDIADLKDNVEALEPRVAANEAAITKLNGDANTAGSVASQVSTAIAALINNAPESFDTLKEIADWIQTHGTEAATLITRIDDAENDIDDLKSRMTAAEGDIDALETGLQTANTNIAANTTAINTLNGNSTTTGSVDYKITQALSPIETRLSDVETNAADAIDHLTWKPF